MLQSLKQIINNIKNTIIIKERQSKPLLGRWNIDYCNKKLNKKIDLSNEDHCGPCGQYIITKKELLYPMKYIKNTKYHRQFETINKN